jgi:hypothetical protein
MGGIQFLYADIEPGRHYSRGQTQGDLGLAGIIEGGGKVEKPLWQPLLIYIVLFLGCQGYIG